MHTLRRGFVADDGRLNLVWRVVLYLLSWWVVFFVGIIVATVVANLFHWYDRGKNAVGAVSASAVLIAWTAVYRRSVDRRPWSGIGLTTPSTGLPMIAAGFAAGSVLVGVWFLIDLALGWVRVVGNEPATSGVPQTPGLVLVGMALWMQRTGRLRWRWRLDDEGLPRSEAD